jgi:uridine kinase
MNNRMKPQVIAIAGVSGGGKTTIANYLHRHLQNSRILFFDDYDFDGEDDIIDWVNRGANYESWDLSPLIKDVDKLRHEPLNYIVLDYPFAYKNAKMSDVIDFTVFIDTPLDVAMARRMLRDFKTSSTATIMREMENYISQGRMGYMEMLKSVKPNSDVVVDGMLSVSEITDKIMEAIKEG